MRVAMIGRWAAAANISALALLRHLQLNSTPLCSSPLSYSSAPPTQPVQSHGWDCWWMCVLRLFKTCSAQLLCNIAFDCSNQAQGRLAKAINLSSKFLECLSLVTEDHSCLVWFPLQRLGFPSFLTLITTHVCVCVCVTIWICLCGSVWEAVSVCCFKLQHIVLCLYIFIYMYAWSSPIKAFVSVTQDVPLVGIVSSSPSSPLLFLPAAARCLLWRQRFHLSLCSYLYPTTSLLSLPDLISDWHV